MQYSWMIATILVLLVGSGAAGIAIKRKGVKSPWGAMIQVGTTGAIVGVFLHNIFWEREINVSVSLRPSCHPLALPRPIVLAAVRRCDDWSGP